MHKFSIEIVLISFSDYNLDPRIQKQIKTLLDNGLYIYLFVRRYVEKEAQITNTKPKQNNLYINEKTFIKSKYAIINILRQISENVRLGLDLRKMKDIKVIQANDTRAWLSGAIARKKGQRLIFDSYELVPENVNGIRKLFWGFLVKILVKRPDVIIHAENNRAEYFKNKYKIDNVEVIENFPYLFTGKIIRNDQNRNIVKIIYAGSILPGRYYEELIRSFSKISSNIILDLWGSGPEKYVSSLKILVNDSKVKNVNFLGTYLQKDLYNILGKYEIGLLFYQTYNLNQYFCAPNKLYEYIQAKIPIISNDIPSIKGVIEKDKIGVCIKNVTTDNVLYAINKIREEELYNNYTNKIKNNYVWENQEQRYVNLFR